MAIPAPADADFTNGELAIGLPAPVGLSLVYFAREVVVERSGVYLIRVWASDGATLKVGRNLASLVTLITAPPNQTIETQVYLQKGVNRIDVEATSELAAFFAMLIFHPDRVLYASSAAGWVYDATAAPADIDVPDGAAAALPVFTTLPNWEDGITERLSYLSEILTSETDAELPRLLRLHPRRSFEADFLRKAAQRSRLDAFMVGAARRMFWMPLWHEQHRVGAAITPASTYVQFPDQTLALREFQVGDRVFVNNGDPDAHEVLQVGSLDYDQDRLYWSAAPVGTWPVGTRVMPLRRARITDQTQMTAPVDRIGRTSLRFELVDSEYRFGASWGACSTVWKFKINRGDDLTFSYERGGVYELDNSLAPAEYTLPGDRALVTMRSSLILRGRAEVVRFRRFIDMASGRAGRFYMPTRMHDIQPAVTTLSGVELDALPQGYTDFILGPQSARAIVAVVFNDGTPDIYRRITNVERVGGVERFTLDAALPSIDGARIERIQYMVPSRFDQDSFEFKHPVDESAAVLTTVLTRSVDNDAMADIDCVD